VMRDGCRRGRNLRRVVRHGNPRARSEENRKELRRSMQGKPGEPQIRYRLQHAGKRERRNPSRW